MQLIGDHFARGLHPFFDWNGHGCRQRAPFGLTAMTFSIWRTLHAVAVAGCRRRRSQYGLGAFLFIEKSFPPSTSTTQNRQAKGTFFFTMRTFRSAFHRRPCPPRIKPSKRRGKKHAPDTALDWVSNRKGIRHVRTRIDRQQSNGCASWESNSVLTKDRPHHQTNAK